MSGYYDPTLVVASFLVAILASYSALYFGAQLTSLSGPKRRLWLLLGALSMGTGVWTMHFVGMQAHVMPTPTSYDLVITLASWLAAVGASGLALYIIGKDRVGPVQILASSLAMGGGIVSMHYVGMAAMKVSPGMSYDPLLFGISVAIAIGASAVALTICRILQSVHGTRGLVFQFAAALTMGIAICGMHYTGMAAMIYPQNATPAADNLLSGGWLGIPLALVSAALILIAVLASATDVKRRKLAEQNAEKEALRVRQRAFFDAATGLPNRTSLEAHLVKVLARKGTDEKPFGVLYLDISARDPGEDLEQRVIARVAGELKTAIEDDVFLCRYSNSAFVLILDNPGSGRQSLYRQLRGLPERIANGEKLLWRAGQSQFPASGRNSRMLIKTAMRTGAFETLGDFGATDNDGSGVPAGAG